MWDQVTNEAVKVALAQPLATIADVIRIQKDVGAALATLDHPSPGQNPITAFNDLYIQVTEEVEAGLESGSYRDGPFMETLDIEFARLYFDALKNWVHGNLAEVKEAWQILFELEDRSGTRHSNLEGAVLGVNAHINFDLTEALLEAVKRNPPGDMAARRADFDSINAVFEEMIDGDITKRLINQLRNRLAKIIFNFLDWVLGDLDEVITLAVITEMRSQAWERAEIFWASTGGPATSLWDDLLAFLAEVLIDTGNFDRSVEGVEPALGRASAALLTTDLLRIEPLDGGEMVRVVSGDRRIPGQWMGESSDLVGLLTADWTKSAIGEQRSIAPTDKIDQLSADLEIISQAFQPEGG